VKTSRQHVLELTAGAKPLLIYADGSCLGNPGPGGWGVVIIEPDGASRELCGYDPATTNNRMEITAAIEGLRSAAARSPVILRSDSEYLVKTVTLRWKRNKNGDLWNALDAELSGREVTLEWVRGHAQDALNNRADELANGAARAGIAAGARAPASSIDTPWLGELVRERAPASARPRTNSPIASPLTPPAGVSASGAPLDLSPAEQEIANRLAPALVAGEALRRCVSCGRIFVNVAPRMTGRRVSPRASARGNSPAEEPDRSAEYCALAECQLRARLSR